jgi:hypothetical protein
LKYNGLKYLIEFDKDIAEEIKAFSLEKVVIPLWIRTLYVQKTQKEVVLPLSKIYLLFEEGDESGGKNNVFYSRTMLVESFCHAVEMSCEEI